MRLELGGVYSPEANPDFLYVIVVLDKARDHLELLALTSNGWSVSPGQVFEDQASYVAEAIADGRIVRVA